MKNSWNFVDITGRKFGRLTAIEFMPKVKKTRKWKCSCDCGGTSYVTTNRLKSGHTQSCGCYQLDSRRKPRKHGHAVRSRGSNISAEYQTWQSIKTRCYNERGKGFKNYGGKGITLCKRWRNSFKNFIADMGQRPDGYSIDRIKSSGNYTPENCRWADNITQSQNRSSVRYVKMNGTLKPMIEWCRDNGIQYKTAHARIKRGWCEICACTIKSNQGKCTH